MTLKRDTPGLLFVEGKSDILLLTYKGIILSKNIYNYFSSDRKKGHLLERLIQDLAILNLFGLDIRYFHVLCFLSFHCAMFKFGSLSAI